MSPFLAFHHFGLAVKQPKAAISTLSLLGYKIGPLVFDPIQNVNLILCEHPTHPAVEIIFSGVGKGPVDNLVQRHASGIIYHLCYETEFLDRALVRFQEAGIEVLCLSAPRPSVLFDGHKVSFYKILGVGMIEILERPFRG
jgi:methylmalonyl-CoA/ethylmalonyl-CoA epimerase